MNSPKCRKTPRRSRRRVAVASAPFYHVTPNYNLYGIDRKGLLTAFSKNLRNAIFVVKRSYIDWAITHVALRHGVAESALVVLGVQVGANQFRKLVDGVYYCKSDIARECLSGLPQRKA